MKKNLRSQWSCGTLTACLLLNAQSLTAQIDIAQKPLFVTAGVEPNIIAGIDNSGSMDSEVLLPTNDGALWWNTNTDSFVGLNASNNDAPGVLNYNRAGGANGTWKKTIYLFPNGTGSGRRVYRDSNNDHYAIPPFPQFAFARSAAYNGMYYDPDQDYVPWPDAGGYIFNDVNPASAPSDPTNGTSTFDLTVLRRDAGDNWRFRFHNGMVIPGGTVTRSGSTWETTAADTPRTGGSASIGVEYYPATYHVPVTISRPYTLTNAAAAVTLSGNCATPDPAHYAVFERNPSGLSGIDALAYDGGCLERVEIIDDGRTFSSGRSYTAEMRNFANWWSYSRKRHMATRSGIGLAFEAIKGVRMGALTINGRNLNGMYSLSNPSERESFFEFIYEVAGNGGGTPNRETLDYIGGRFDNNNSVITESCQQNFALLFTDGFSNPNTSSGVGNADGNMDSPFADSHSNTIADIGAYYYNRVLRSGDFDRDNVPVPSQCAVTNPPSYVDCNTELHMVTYGITLGAQGNIFGQTHFDTEYAHTDPPVWQNPTQTRNPVQVDDLYHAAVNSRGEMLNAQSAAELRQVLSDALLDIVDRSTQSATSASTSSPIIDENGKATIYSVAFRSDDWTGDVFSRESDFNTTSGLWSAETALADRNPATRNLLTYNGTAKIGSPLIYSSLSQTQKDVLDFGLDNSDDGAGAQRVAWLRGEAQTDMRSRSTFDGDLRLIGDIVSSTPRYRDAQNDAHSLLPAAFSPETYSTFRGSLADRPAMLAVGANDGFLHVFDADNGTELFAYMPSELLEPVPGNNFANATLLTAQDYDHRYFVDGTPTIKDALMQNGGWKTVLVGSMGVGGKSIFALDITDPENMDSSDVLWEFSDPDMGYGVTNVQIVPMANGKFAAVFGNGYNSENHRAFLFVVDLIDGSLLAKVDTGQGSETAPNGLSQVTASSWPVGNGITQYIYAGDLLGNLWRFNVTNAAPAQWRGPETGTNENVELVFVATDPSGNRQPITVQPRLYINPERSGEVIVNFGTGSYFREQDKSLSNPQIQSIYGIRLRESVGDTHITRVNLLEQTIQKQVTIDGGPEPLIGRVLSKNQYSGDIEEKGWRIDLNNGGSPGERIISMAQPASSPNIPDRTRISSLIPSDDACGSGRSSFLFDLDLFTGGRTEGSVFDINNDDFFNVGDVVDGDVINAISIGSGELLLPIRNRAGDKDFFYDGAGNRLSVTGKAEGDPLGRQSWQQLR